MESIKIKMKEYLDKIKQIKIKNFSKQQKISLAIVLLLLLTFIFQKVSNILDDFGAKKYGNSVILYPIYYETYEDGVKYSHTGFINSKGVLAKNKPYLMFGFIPSMKKGLINGSGPNPFFDYKKINELYKIRTRSIESTRQWLAKEKNPRWRNDALQSLDNNLEDINKYISTTNENQKFHLARSKKYITISQLPSAINNYEHLFKSEDGASVNCDKQYCGIVNNQGNFIIPRSYDKPVFQLDLTTPYISNHFYGDDSYFLGGYYFDLNGNKLFEKQFDVENSLPFIEGLAWVYETKMISTNPKRAEVIRAGYINKKGKYVWSVKATKQAPILWEKRLTE